MKNKERRNLNFWWGNLLVAWSFFVVVFCFLTESHIPGFIYTMLLVMVGFLYFLSRDTKKRKNMEHPILEDIRDEEEKNSVDVKFDLSKLGDKNTFLLIKIPSSFIDEFKKYNLSLNSPSILGKKIYEWGDRDNGMCVQNVLCFSKAEIKSTIEQVTNEVYAAIEWLPNKNGEQSICIQKWVKFACE